MDMMDLTISFPDQSVVNVRVPCLSTVRDLKCTVEAKAGEQSLDDRSAVCLEDPKLEMVLIFAGCELKDSEFLRDRSVPNGTVIHAVYRPNGGLSCLDGEELNGSFEKLASDDEEDIGWELVSDKSVLTNGTFYGFCKKTCKEITPALLRFSCAQCASPKVTVDESQLSHLSWDEVRRKHLIPGYCYNGCGEVETTMRFKCGAHRNVDGEDGIVYLPHVRLNQNDTPCATCLNVQSPVICFFCLQDQHVMCLACFQEYSTILLNARKFVWTNDGGYGVMCPFGCRDSLLHDAHIFYILGPEMYQKYKDFAAEECFVRHGGLFCPEASCGTAFIDASENSFGRCPNGHRVCRDCRERNHDGPCQSPVVSVGSESGKSIAGDVVATVQSRRLIARTTKPCPGCRTPVERDGGCMHMICSHCQKEFCWICLTDWGMSCLTRHWFG